MPHVHDVSSKFYPLGIRRWRLQKMWGVHQQSNGIHSLHIHSPCAPAGNLHSPFTLLAPWDRESYRRPGFHIHSDCITWSLVSVMEYVLG